MDANNQSNSLDGEPSVTRKAGNNKRGRKRKLASVDTRNDGDETTSSSSEQRKSVRKDVASPVGPIVTFDPKSGTKPERKNANSLLQVIRQYQGTRSSSWCRKNGERIAYYNSVGVLPVAACSAEQICQEFERSCPFIVVLVKDPSPESTKISVPQDSRIDNVVKECRRRKIPVCRILAKPPPFPNSAKASLYICRNEAVFFIRKLSFDHRKRFRRICVCLLDNLKDIKNIEARMQKQSTLEYPNHTSITIESMDDALRLCQLLQKVKSKDAALAKIQDTNERGSLKPISTSDTIDNIVSLSGDASNVTILFRDQVHSSGKTSSQLFDELRSICSPYQNPTFFVDRKSFQKLFPDVPLLGLVVRAVDKLSDDILNNFVKFFVGLDVPPLWLHWLLGTEPLRPREIQTRSKTCVGGSDSLSSHPEQSLEDKPVARNVESAENGVIDCIMESTSLEGSLESSGDYLPQTIDRKTNVGDDAVMSNIQIDSPPTENDKSNCDIDKEKEIALLEEQISIYESTLSQLRSRRDFVEKEEKLALLQSNKSKKKVQLLEIELSKWKDNHTQQVNLQLDLSSSLSKSRGLLERLMSTDVDMTVEEIQEIALEGDGMEIQIDQKATGLEQLDSTPLQAIEEGKASAAGDVEEHHSIKIYVKPVEELESLKLFWRVRVPFTKCLAGFIPCLRSPDLMTSLMESCALETLAVDALDSSARHRMESLWNTCLDGGLLSRTEPTSQSVSGQTEAIARFDRTVQLCPYELNGECADHACPYQHLQDRPQGKVLPRELLPLPGFYRSVKKSISQLPHESMQRKDNVTLAPCVNHLCTEAAEADMYNFDGQDDFVALPESTDDDCVNEGTVFHGKDEIQEAENIVIPEHADSQISLTELLASRGCKFQDKAKTVIVLGESHYHQHILHGLEFVKCVIDWCRLAVHAGRFDLASSFVGDDEAQNQSSLMGSFLEIWCDDSVRQDALAQVKDLCRVVLETVNEAHKKAFAYDTAGPQSNVFDVAFTTQVVFKVCSLFIEDFRRNLKNLLPSDSRLHGAISCGKANARKLKLMLEESEVGDTSSSSNTLNLGHAGFSQGFSTKPWDSTLDPVSDFRQWKARYMGATGISSGESFDRIEAHFNEELERLSVNMQSDPLAHVNFTIRYGYILTGKLIDVVTEILGGREEFGSQEVKRLCMHAQSFIAKLHDTSKELDTLLAPLLAATLSLLAMTRNYRLVHSVLARMLVRSCPPETSESEKGAVFHLSEFLWSQLFQLRLSFPTAEFGRSDPSHRITELSNAARKEIEFLTKTISLLEVHLNHVVVPNDWNLVHFLSTNLGPTHNCTVDGDLSANPLQLMALSQAMQRRNQDEKCELSLRGVSMCLRSTYGQPSSHLSAFPLVLLSTGPMLTVLNLGACRLRRLPLHFGRFFRTVIRPTTDDLAHHRTFCCSGLYFPQLRELNLEENDLHQLPSSLTRISSLEKLVVDSNNIQSLPSPFHFPQMVEFSARDNSLGSLPTSLRNCKALEVLDLQGNPFQSDPRLLASDLPNLYIFNY